MGAADFLEVLQDAAFELVDMVVADVLHVDRGLLAADAAGAEGHHGLVRQRSFCCATTSGNSLNLSMR